jgi:uncharacterized protein YndB with AHSA1/START domain
LNESLQIHQDTFIAAPPAVVFAYLTDPEKIVGWMGVQATTEVRPGGVYLLQGVSRHKRTARGAFREVVPVHRLAYSFGWEDDSEVPPGSTLIEFDLIDQNGGTLLKMTQSGLPNAAQCEGHSIGWAHYVARLAVFAAGGELATDPGPQSSLH